MCQKITVFLIRKKRKPNNEGKGTIGFVVLVVVSSQIIIDSYKNIY